MLWRARGEGGASPPPMHPLDIRAVITDAISRVRPQVELKGGTLEAHIDDRPLTVMGDAERLGKAAVVTAAAERAQTKASGRA
ncbi:hypothetical protein B4Q13_18670 [Lacticaseibacillus rhamnosus]